jgi:hypothetical protein
MTRDCLTGSWASVAAGGRTTGSGTSLSQTTNAEKPNREPSHQLVIDVSRGDGEAAEKAWHTGAGHTE